MKRTLPVGSYAVTPDGSVFVATADDTTQPPGEGSKDLPGVNRDSEGSSSVAMSSETYWSTAGRLGGPE